MNTIALDQKSKLTIIQGPQGSGKTTLARMISNRSRGMEQFVKNYIGPTTIEGRMLFSDPSFTPFPIGSKVVIVEEVDLTEAIMGEIKELANSTHFDFKRSGLADVKIATPHFIFCVTTEEYNHVNNYANTARLDNIQLIDLGAL